ncbi:MAG: HD domain-containing protein [Saprospirales bacterium]|nr:MAG: HD domain-containing protein [Saprospirales bacterium]
MRYQELEKFVLVELEKNLSPKLTYHGVHHTRDVLQICIAHCKRFQLNQENTTLLKTGALMHDTGFLYTYDEHEKKGVEIAERILPRFKFSKRAIKIISGLIMATKVPQEPKTGLEEIICDADLDYLGRDDFYPISESLFEELKQFKGLTDRNKWNQIQVSFFESHQFHTEWAQKYRAPVKAKYLEELKEIVK